MTTLAQSLPQIKVFDGADFHTVTAVGTTGEFESFWLDETLVLVQMHTGEVRKYQSSSDVEVLWQVGANDASGEPLFEYDTVLLDDREYIVGWDPEALGFSLFSEERNERRPLTLAVAAQTRKTGNRLCIS